MTVRPASVGYLSALHFQAVVVPNKEDGNVMGISFRAPSLSGMMDDAAASPHRQWFWLVALFYVKSGNATTEQSQMQQPITMKREQKTFCSHSSEVRVKHSHVCQSDAASPTASCPPPSSPSLQVRDLNSRQRLSCVQLSWTVDPLPHKVCRSTVITPPCAHLRHRYPQRCRWSVHVLISNRGPPPSYAFVTRVYRRNLRPVVMASAHLAALSSKLLSDSFCR